MAQWRITPAEYFQRLDLDALQFEKALQLPSVDQVVQIVPLRDLRSLQAVIPISRDMLVHLLRRVKTLDGQLPFEHATVRTLRVDSEQLKVGQKFVYRENYQRLLEGGTTLFHRFVPSGGGLGDLSAYFMFGWNGNDAYSLSCYLPPIIEKHGADLVVMDGIHRNFVARKMGMPLNAIVLENVSVPFPCSVQDWDAVDVIPLIEKPKELEDRYFNLNKDLFRDLKYLGIDG